MTAAVAERRDADYKSEVKVTWCPGCGDFGVLNATYKALAEQQYDTKDVVVVSGIGCSSRFPFFVSTYGFHGVHGRALPIATGIKMSRPELEVIVFGGEAKKPTPANVVIGSLQPNPDGTPSAYICRPAGCSAAFTDPAALSTALR